MFISPLVNQLFISYVWLPNVIYFPKQIIRSMGDITSFLINFPQQEHSNSPIFPMAVQELKYLGLDFSLHLLTKVHTWESTCVNPGFWLQAIKWIYKHTSIDNRKKTNAVSHKIQIDRYACISFLTATARHSFPNNLLSLSMEYTVLEHYTFQRSAGSPSEQFQSTILICTIPVVVLITQPQPAASTQLIKCQILLTWFNLISIQDLSWSTTKILQNIVDGSLTYWLEENEHLNYSLQTSLCLYIW